MPISNTMKKFLTIFISVLATAVYGQVSQKSKPTDFLPKGYVLSKRVNGDLNKDGTEDCVLIIKGTDKSKIVRDEQRGKLDGNRRGIIVLLKNKTGYKLASKNYNCFSSENEDGGVYFPPELIVEIKNANLYIHYAHGRYGFRRYTFRFQNSDFELIGYDASHDSGPVVNSEVSINFLTRKKQEKVNTNQDAEGGDEIFKTTWTKVNIARLIRLSEIEDFHELNMNY